MRIRHVVLAAAVSMCRSHVTALLALSALALLPSSGSAQRIFGASGGQATSNPGGVKDRDVPICGTSGGGSRTRKANCEVDQPPKPVRTQIKLPPPAEALEAPTAQCAATTTTEYLQRNTKAHVDSRLAISNCAAAAGTFKFSVRIRDASGELKPLEFAETWQRSDDQDVKFTAEYPIGENVELVSVRVRDMLCTCADASSAQSAQSEERAQ
jgi:hypothetical protein